MWFGVSQCYLQFSFCQCLCETTATVGWMTALSVVLVSIHSDIHACARLQCVCPVLAKCVLNYVAFFLLSVTYASSVLSGYRLTLCFGIFPFNLCRSLHALRSSFLWTIFFHAISHLSALQCFVNSFTCASTLL